MLGVSNRSPCGVRDYATALAEELRDCGVVVRSRWVDIPGTGLVGALAGARAVCAEALRLESGSRLLWHYSPFAYAYRGVVLPGVVAGVLARLRRARVTTVAHELALAPAETEGLRRRLVRLSQELALRSVLLGSNHVVVTTRRRHSALEDRCRRSQSVSFVPVFGTVVPDRDLARADGTPQGPFRVGVFGFAGEDVDRGLIVGALAAMVDPVELVLLGAPGPHEPASALWARACKDLGVAVTFSGVLAPADLSRAIASCHALVHGNAEGPSSRKTTLAAGLAHGRPLVAVDGPNRWAELADSGAALVVAPTAAAVRTALVSIKDDPDRAEALGAAAARFYDEHSSRRRAAAAVAEVVHGLKHRVPRIAFVVNRPGLQDRRAEALSGRLSSAFATRTVVGSLAAPLRRAIRWADLVYVIDPGRVGFPAAMMARSCARPVIVEMGDPQGPLYRAQGRSGLSVWAGRTVDAFVGRYASGVVVRGRRLAEEVDIKVPWIEVPDGVDLDRFRPTADDDLRQQLGIPDDALVVGLVGSLEVAGEPPRSYGWDIVGALAMLRDEPVWGLVVGDGPGRAWLRKRAEDAGVTNRLVLPGRVAHDEVPRYVSAIDLCISTQTDDAIGRSRTTAKLPEYLACDRHVLASAVGGACDVLPPGMLVPYHGSYDPAYPRRLAERIAAVVPARAELRRSGKTRHIAAECFSYDVIADKISAFLAQLGLI